MKLLILFTILITGCATTNPDGTRRPGLLGSMLRGAGNGLQNQQRTVTQPVHCNGTRMGGVTDVTCK